MIEPIKKPNWLKLHEGRPDKNSLEGRWVFDREAFNTWFKAEVEPINKMFNEGVEVYGWDNKDWERQEKHIQGHDHSHRALLINIQPIKKETADDMLREILNDPSVVVDSWPSIKKRLETIIY